MNSRTELETNDAEEGLYVLQIIGDDLAAIVETVLLMAGLPERIEVATNEPSGPSFVHASDDLDQVLRSLEDGRFGAAILRTSTSGIRFALLTAPNAFGGHLSRWMGSIEFAGPAQNWRDTWPAVLNNDRLVAASVSLDDGIDLFDDQLSVDGFPWRESRLVVAAVRGTDGSWVTRENPQPSW